MSDQGAETDIPETIQSLLVAFAIALVFRGFVVEGFVIPTGSMAPTLLGEHVRYETPDTGYEYAFDPTALLRPDGTIPPDRGLIDPMVSQDVSVTVEPARSILEQRRAGDRVLVLKYLYTFSEPKRWDVVVFKSPTDPIGPAQNYIKRLVGLPNEQLLVVDGDVFTAPPEGTLDDFRIVRRPEFVQESVWQPVYDSDYVPLDPERLARQLGRPADGPPFKSSDQGWSLQDSRAWRWSGGDRTRLDWAYDQLPIDDFNAYNALRYPQSKQGPLTVDRRVLKLQDVVPVSDVRISASIDPDDPATFSSVFELTARGHLFRFGLTADGASIEMLDGDGGRVGFSETEASFAGGDLVDVSFVHVDQSLAIVVGGDVICSLDYEWNPMQRLEATYDRFDLGSYRRGPGNLRQRTPRLSWTFEGSPVTLRRVRVERDLHYKTGRLDAKSQVAANGPFIAGMLYSTDPENPARLGPDQFLMFGDNSGASRDSRYWGRPHPLSVAATGDETPFVVHRDLLVGKAWCVYFPAPNPVAGSGPSVVPDLGRLRFIR